MIYPTQYMPRSMPEQPQHLLNSGGDAWQTSAPLRSIVLRISIGSGRSALIATVDRL